MPEKIKLNQVCPTWMKLAALGESQILKSSYIWLIITPIASNFFAHIQSPRDLVVFETIFSINFDLPFSLKLFFTAALLIAIANTIFVIKRPEFTTFKDFGDFQNQGRTASFLKKEFLLMYDNHNNKRSIRVKIDELRKELKLDNSNGPFAVTSEITWLKNAMVAGTNPAILAGVFWILTKEENRKDTYYRFACFLFYIAGLILILTVMFENVYFVYFENKLFK